MHSCSTADFHQPPCLSHGKEMLRIDSNDECVNKNGLKYMHSTEDSNCSIDPGYNLKDNYYDNNSCDLQQQLSTDVSKVQIKLNHLINNHRASLKLHDDIMNLFNEYTSSLNFDLYAKLKSRKYFIKSMESSYRVTHLHHSAPKDQIRYDDSGRL